MDEQCSGEEFRFESEQITRAIAKKTMRGLNPDRVVVMMPWRAGLAFGYSYKCAGVSRFYHVSSKRDEETLETIVDHESGLVEPGDTVIVADPMLATGNTAVDAIERLLRKGVLPEHIIINAVVAAPVGVDTVKKYPGIRVVVGALDKELDHRGYIVDGLGDFGDKYCHGLSREDVHRIADALNFKMHDRLQLFKRFGMSKPSLREMGWLNS